jgi:hypothetical protein
MKSKVLFIFFVVFISGAKTSAEALVKHSRLSAVEFSITGYEPLSDVRSYLEAGVAEDPSDMETPCKVLEPRANTVAAKQPWAPFDFYTNIRDVAEQSAHTKTKTVGEPDIFFAGDDGNRNRANHKHQWTRRVADNFKGSMEFTEKRLAKDWFSFLVVFSRGALSNKSLLSYRTWMQKGQCQGAVFECTKRLVDTNGKSLCEPDGWTKQVSRVVAEASISGAAYDKLFGTNDEKKKNDLAALNVEYRNLDANGDPIGDFYLEKVAPK